MKNWSMTINNDVIALDISPSDLIKALMPAWSGDRNPMRDPEPETLKSLKPAPDSTTLITPSHYPYPMPSYPFYNPYEPSLHQTPTPLHQTLTHSKSNNACIDILSSPLVSEDDQMEKLMNYVDWLAIRTLRRNQIRRKEGSIMPQITTDFILRPHACIQMAIV